MAESRRKPRANEEPDPDDPQVRRRNVMWLVIFGLIGVAAVAAILLIAKFLSGS